MHVLPVSVEGNEHKGPGGDEQSALVNKTNYFTGQEAKIPESEARTVYYN